MRADEYVVEELLKLKAENEDLKQQLSMYEDLEKVQEKWIEFWRNKYYELVEKLKEKWNPQIQKLDDMDYIYFSTFTVYNGNYNGHSKEDYEYFRKLFNLKEETEEEGEKKDEIQ